MGSLVEVGLCGGIQSNCAICMREFGRKGTPKPLALHGEPGRSFAVVKRITGPTVPGVGCAGGPIHRCGGTRLRQERTRHIAGGRGRKCLRGGPSLLGKGGR